MKKFTIWLGVLALVWASIACSSTTKTLEEAAQDSTKAVSMPTVVSGSKSTVEATPQAAEPATATPVVATPTPAATATAKPSPTPLAQDLKLAEGPVFVQTRFTVGVYMVVENPNKTQAISGSQVQITAYDEAGTVLKTETDYVQFVLPEEKIPVTAKMYLEDGQKVAKVEAQLVSGNTEATDLKAPLFTQDQVQFVADPNFPKVTGVLKNTFKRSFSDLQITAVLYDHEGKLVGGGFTFLPFLPGDGQSAIDVSVDVTGKPEKIFLVASVSSLSMLMGDNSENQSVQLLDYGWSQTSRTVSLGFVVKNADEKQFIGGTQYQVSAYDAAGKVLDTNSGYVSLLFPGETTAGAVSMILPTGTKAAKVDIQINPGKPTKFALDANPFTTDKVTFLPGSFSSKVTGILKNSYKEQITYVEVVALGYDKDGKIIGGGSTFVEVVPANGQAAFSVMTDLKAKPDKVVAFVQLGSLSQIGK